MALIPDTTSSKNYTSACTKGIRLLIIAVLMRNTAARSFGMPFAYCEREIGLLKSLIRGSAGIGEATHLPPTGADAVNRATQLSSLGFKTPSIRKGENGQTYYH
jgi:hypothetical protein